MRRVGDVMTARDEIAQVTQTQDSLTLPVGSALRGSVNAGDCMLSNMPRNDLTQSGLLIRNKSPRWAWVKAHGSELITIAESFGATRLCLCGSVARGEDAESSRH